MSSEKDFSDKNCDPQKGEINMERKIDPNKDSTGKTTIDTLSNLVDSLSIGNNQQKPQTNKSAQEFDLKNTVTIPEWLSDCETPFSWHLEQERGLGPELVIMRTLEKLDELLIEEPEFSLQRFVSLLKLILEYFVIGDIDKCCENMKIIDGCLEEEISRNDPLYQKVKLSLGHVVSATKAHVLFIIGKEEESKKIGRCIIPVKIMADVDKAALSSMKARFFLYSGYEDGEAVGVGYAKKALELEPGNPEWEYLLAKMLRQERRDIPFSNEVPRDELKLLESAVEKEKNPKYLVYLAQVYRECSQQAFKRYKNHPNFQGELQSSIERMAVKSLECYKEALTLCPDSPGVLRRVGYGIMNLPKKFADYNLALECLLKSLEISENQMTLHVLGTYYHRYGNDNVKALEYFERIAKTGSWFGLSDKIRIKWILDHNYDPVPDLEIGLSWKMKKNYRHQVLAQLGAYYLFIKRDFHKSLEYFKQVILEDKDAPQMTNFKSFFLRMNQPIDLYTYLVNEALLLVQKHDSSSTVEPETSDDESVVEPSVVGVGYVEDFLDLISQVRPELMEMTPDSELVPKLIQTSTEIENNCNRFNNRGRNNSRGNYSDNRGRGRGNYGNRGGNRRFTQEDGNERRGRYSYSNQRETPEDGNERRGRFSFANQRERGPEGGERRGGDRRGGFSRGKTQNWRPRPKNDQGGDDDKKDHENWRKK